MRTIKTAVINGKNHDITYDPATVSVEAGVDGGWVVEAVSESGNIVTFPDTFECKLYANELANQLRQEE